jgi:hypothetical protein
MPGRPNTWRRQRQILNFHLELQKDYQKATRTAQLIWTAHSMGPTKDEATRKAQMTVVPTVPLSVSVLPMEHPMVPQKVLSRGHQTVPQKDPRKVREKTTGQKLGSL